MKQSPTSDLQRWATLIQRWGPTLKQRCYTVVLTLFQRSLNVVKAKSKPIGPLISKDFQID